MQNYNFVIFLVGKCFFVVIDSFKMFGLLGFQLIFVGILLFERRIFCTSKTVLVYLKKYTSYVSVLYKFVNDM